MRFAVASQMPRQSNAAGRALSVFLFLALALIIGWLLVALKFIFLPMLLALFATFFLSPPVEWLHRRRVPRPVGLVITLAAVGAAIWLGGRYVAASIVAFRDGFPRYEERIRALVEHARAVTDHFPFITMDRLKEAVNDISLSGLVGDTLNSFLTGFGYVVVTILFMMYFLPAVHSLPQKISRAFPDKRGPMLRKAFESIGQQVQKYIWAKTLASIITGVGVAVPCLIFGLDFAVTWGVFAALLNFVPTVGSLLSVVPPVLVCALQPDLGQLTTVLWLTGILVAIMTLTGNFMEPLMLGQSVNLSPTASLIALF
ncbi:MAG: AI-2E family transporter, partial [Candidatus Adiutrix sp.]|nr:AI-2E family transporter [Candidatus Adiutrix sp.]